MTVKELKDKLSAMDDDSILTLQTEEGLRCEVSHIDRQGGYVNLWGDHAV